jgi:trans-aconitate 2-methyltransferase
MTDSATSWSAQQYSKFERERTRPVRDLVAAIPAADVKYAVDLGCGPGNSTEVLAQRYPHAEVVGMDNAQDMIEAARKRLPSVRFELSEISTWSAQKPCDVILANASLQWLPDHRTLYPRLASQLTEGGSLAVQTPDNLAEPAHLLAAQLGADARWRAKIGAGRHHERHGVDFYFSLLKPVCRTVDIWRTTYSHVLQGGPSAVVEWFKATALRPYLGPLNEDEKAEFLEAYTAAIAKAYPAYDDGTVLLPFPRLFVVATR